MFCRAKHVFAFRSETPFFIDSSRATREGILRGAAPYPARSSLPLRSAPCLCATGARRPFKKGGRKLHSLAIAAGAGEVLL